MFQSDYDLFKLIVYYKEWKYSKDIVITKPNIGNRSVILDQKLYNSAIE